MKPRTRTLPVDEFIEPDEKLWPGAQKIDEFGRVVLASSSRNGDAPKTTAPTNPTAPPDDRAAGGRSAGRPGRRSERGAGHRADAAQPAPGRGMT